MYCMEGKETNNFSGRSRLCIGRFCIVAIVLVNWGVALACEFQTLTGDC
jgi:hypothetical protein